MHNPVSVAVMPGIFGRAEQPSIDKKVCLSELKRAQGHQKVVVVWLRFDCKVTSFQSLCKEGLAQFPDFVDTSHWHTNRSLLRSHGSIFDISPRQPDSDGLNTEDFKGPKPVKSHIAKSRSHVDK